MVGLLIVSHSYTLAKDIVSYIRRMVPKDIPLAYAGGTGENNKELGTNAQEIADAIKSIYSDDGIIVMMDIGSAIMSSKLAIDMTANTCKNVIICPGALVEGSIAAASAIAAGQDIKFACEEAVNALSAKNV